MLGFPLLYFKGMRLMMFQLSSFYCMSSCYCTLLWICWLQSSHKAAPKNLYTCQSIRGPFTTRKRISGLISRATMIRA